MLNIGDRAFVNVDRGGKLTATIWSGDRLRHETDGLYTVLIPMSTLCIYERYITDIYLR